MPSRIPFPTFVAVGRTALFGTVGLVGLIAAGCSSGSAAKSAAPPTTAAASAGSSGSGTSSASGSNGSDPCSAIKQATLSALFTIPFSKPYYSDQSCEYGLGANANKSGVAIVGSPETASINIIPNDGQAQYAAAIKPVVDVVLTPLSGVGDKATFAYNSLFPKAPAVFAIKGDTYCDVELNLMNTSDVGLAANSDAAIAPSDAAGLAQKEGAICNDVFSAS